MGSSKRAKKFMLILFSIIALYFLIFGRYGLVRVIALQLELSLVNADIIRLEASRVALKWECDNLENNPDYIEKIANARLIR
ncbi:MAG TPA: septum formation initiator family protein [bacterium (Candidatus Stahlbacteria)]|nr:septum formation initiator family protein [Candidatus Stahlbacteria bacterium]